MTTSLLNAWRNSKASRATRTTASGSSPFTWKIGASIMRATSVAYIEERDDCRGGGEADLVVDDDVHRAAGAVAAQLRHVQRLGDDALAREGRVAVERHRQDGEVRAALADDVLLGAGDTLDDRVDRLQVGGVGGRARP